MRLHSGIPSLLAMRGWSPSPLIRWARDGSDIPMDRKVGEERLNLYHAHVLGVTLAVKENVASDPLEIGLFGANQVMLLPDNVTHLIEQLWWLLWHDLISPIFLLTILNRSIYNAIRQ